MDGTGRARSRGRPEALTSIAIVFQFRASLFRIGAGRMVPVRQSRVLSVGFTGRLAAASGISVADRLGNTPHGSKLEHAGRSVRAVRLVVRGVAPRRARSP